VRELTSHKVNECNDGITIKVQDEPGKSGASCRYMASFVNPDVDNHYLIRFHNGPLPGTRVNGLTHEALLAILIDRLESFQEGPFACRENDAALTFLESAMMWLKNRTECRLARGVEGTHTV